MPKQINKYLLFFIAVIAAFWQIAFLQNGMKWDFVDAFLPSRYFFSESVLNNQFPLWNPYLLYGSPIFADLVSVFNPEYWIIANLFGYNNIVLQFVYLGYVIIAGISFYYLLKQFKADNNILLAISLAYMFSGFTIGNAQHLAFVSGYALVPFLLAAYLQFLRKINKINFVRLALAVYLMVFCSYPAIAIISGYLLLVFLVFYVIANRKNKIYLRQIFAGHLILLAITVLFSAVLFVAYFQAQPFLDRYTGLSIDLAQKHAFTFQSFISFLFPMATGVETDFFATDNSMSNAYFGLFSLVLLTFCLLSKKKNSESYLFLFFGIFSLLAALGKQFFLREFLYHYFPLLNMFQYPALFRAFAIFGFLAFTGINFNPSEIIPQKRKLLAVVSFVFIVLIVVFIVMAISRVNEFIYFHNFSFNQKLQQATRSENIIFQGIFQLSLLLFFLIFTLKTKNAKKYPGIILFLFLIDLASATQFNIRYTVINNDNPLEFAAYLKNSPKGFPVPDLRPMEENSDKNASNKFVWMNNNVFPKRATFDGKVAFKLNGYTLLDDNFPALLDSIKTNPLVYFSADVRNANTVENFTSETVFLPENNLDGITAKNSNLKQSDFLQIVDFKPSEINIQTSAENARLLVFQQNYFKGWKVYIDGVEHNLQLANFTHLAVFVPAGEHVVTFRYKNQLVIILFVFSTCIFLLLIFFALRLYTIKNPIKKRQIKRLVFGLLAIFVVIGIINRQFYQKNKRGLANEIIGASEKYKSEFYNKLAVFLSTSDKNLQKKVQPDKTQFIHESRNMEQLSTFLMNAGPEYFMFAWNNCFPGNNVFELIRSFYPETIDFKKQNNSGIILAKKNEKLQPYNFNEDFENDNQLAYWEDSRIQIDSISGTRVFHFSENDEWGSAMQFIVDEDLKKARQVALVSDIKMVNKNEALLVVTVERQKENLLYEAFKMNNFIQTGEWQRISFLVDFDFELQQNDQIKVYFWNNKQSNFYLDNIKLRFVF